MKNRDFLFSVVLIVRVCKNDFFLSPLRVGWVSLRQEFNTTNHTHTRPQEYIWFDILPYTEKGLFYSALYIVRDLVIMCAISFEFGEAQND